MKAKFSSEAGLCATFIAQLPPEWVAYPETANYDIVLVRTADGLQIGVEAKLTLNTIVIQQILEGGRRGVYATAEGPDFRAVLVPSGTAGNLGFVCHRLGITVIEQMDKAMWEQFHGRFRLARKVNDVIHGFKPELPGGRKHQYNWWDEDAWHDCAPYKRITLPDYVPDVTAGRSGPVKLTDWKMKAIKIAILVEKRSFVTRLDFKHIGIDHRRWLDGYSGWLKRGERRGEYVAGTHIGAFRKQHPVNYAQIEADYEKWAPKEDSSLTP